MKHAVPNTNGAGDAVPRWATSKPEGSKRKKRRPLVTRRDRMHADLKRSGLTEEGAKRMRCKPISGAKAKRLLGLRNVNLPDGYLIPYLDGNGEPIDGAFRWRALAPWTRRAKDGTREPGPKYLQPRGSSPQLYLVPSIDWHSDHNKIVITEGEKKAAAACRAGITTIAIGGVYSWKVPRSEPDELLPDFDEVLDEGVEVELCFDSDLEKNPDVRLALARLAAALDRHGYHVRVVYLPPASDDEKIGLDDFLVDAGRRPNGKFSRIRARRAFEKLPRHDPPFVEPITIRCAANIQPERLRPIWPNVLYQSKVTLMAGEPGLGKSLLTCDVAARVSTAADWPGGGSAVIGPADVLMISGEDDPEDTIVPRLIAAGADLTRIHVIDDVIEKRDGELLALSIDKHASFVHAAMMRQKAKLLIIDPVSAFMGDRDSHKDTAVRALINKVRSLASDGDYAVLMVTHFNKPGEKASSAVHRVMGSLGFVAAARSVYAFLRDPDDPDHRVFLPIKVNLGPDQDGFRCHIEVDNKQNLSPPPPYLQWDDEAVEGQRVDEVLTQASPRAQARKVKEQEIAKFLDEYIKPGKRRPSKKFNKKCSERGYNEKLVRTIMAQQGYRKEAEKGSWPAKWWVCRDEVR